MGNDLVKALVCALYALYLLVATYNYSPSTQRSLYPDCSVWFAFRSLDQNYYANHFKAASFLRSKQSAEPEQQYQVSGR